MVKLAAVVVLAGTFLFSSGCCWPTWEGRHHRYGDRYGDASPAPGGERYGDWAPRGRSEEDRRADRN
jgi:hypothetical protein